MEEKSNIIYIYANGTTQDNQDPKNNLGAWGVVLRLNGKEKIFCGIEENTTNNKMELLSAIMGLSKIKNRKTPVIVVMDSQYVVDGASIWSKKWKINGWKTSDNKPVANIEYWRWLLDIISSFENITFKKCYGHTDNEGNNKADKLCNVTMDEYIGGHKDTLELEDRIKQIFESKENENVG
jgi:ribonuclease HI